jgi:hypothetical protein
MDASIGIALHAWPPPALPSGTTVIFRFDTESRWSGYARSGKTRCARSCNVYSPSTSAVKVGTLPSWYA